MRVTYRMLQAPTKGAGAFMPGLTRGAAPVTAGQLQAGITGMPGTVQIPSPRPAALNDEGLGGPLNQPSAVAPNWFTPSIYIQRLSSSLHFPGKILSDHVLPVPAGNPGRTPLQWQHRFRIGGRTATGAVRPFIQWPTYGGA